MVLKIFQVARMLSSLLNSRMANPLTLIGLYLPLGLGILLVGRRRKRPDKQCVALGSTNPGKLRAVQEGLAAWPGPSIFDVQGVSTASGVAEQPMGLEETARGARNRAAGALSAVSVQCWVWA